MARRVKLMATSEPTLGKYLRIPAPRELPENLLLQSFWVYFQDTSKIFPRYFLAMQPAMTRLRLRIRRWEWRWPKKGRDETHRWRKRSESRGLIASAASKHSNACCRNKITVTITVTAKFRSRGRHVSPGVAWFVWPTKNGPRQKLCTGPSHLGRERRDYCRRSACMLNACLNIIPYGLS